MEIYNCKKARVLGGQVITGLSYYLEANRVVHIRSGIDAEAPFV